MKFAYNIKGETKMVILLANKFPILNAAIIHPQAWRRETPGMLPSPHGDTAIPPTN